MKKLAVKVTEQGSKITLTFDQIQAQKSVRNFDPANSAPKVHSANKGKGSYNRKEKHKGREEDKDSDLCF